MSNLRLIATVTGEVQGVGFRYRARQQAEQLGLVGSATNRPDGSVRVVAEGPSSSIEQLLRWLRSDRTPGRVDQVHASTDHAEGGLTGFDTD